MPKVSRIISDVDNIIFLSNDINVRAGGPSGYIANLKNGLDLHNDSSIKIVIIHGSNMPCKSLMNTVKKHFLKVITFWIPVQKYRRKVRSWLDSIIMKNIKINDKYSCLKKELNRYNFKSITCHFVDDALFIRDYLNKRRLNAKLILMSHSPQPPSQELYNELIMAKDIQAEVKYHEFAKKEEECFTKVPDIFLFPSKESIEPYSSSLSYFKDILEQKVIKFLATGCTPLDTDKSVEELRRQYHIETPYVISYIGRHISIKGYDLLQNIAKKILSVRQDVTFLIGGNMKSGIPPLEHKNWLELGFVNPAEVFKVSDCFILPNRQTYFDLILLEALSMGTVVFASNTGGNKTVYQQTNAIFLYTSEDDCVRRINQFLDASEEEKQQLRDKARKAYLKNYTLDIFGRNYINLIKDVIGDV